MTKKTTTPLDLWNKVCKTNPKYTREVKFGSRGFTAINPQYQIMKATEQFGPFGEGWGVRDERLWLIADGLLGYQATLWYKNGTKVCEFDINASITTHMGSKLDDDCFKKVSTDALTKGLSKLGFNADVFLGLWDDNKYVNQMEKEFSKANTAKELFTLTVGDDNWVNVLKYVTVNKKQGLEKLAQTLGKKYKITKPILSELDKVLKG